MAGRMALNLGKGAFQKISNKNNQDPTPTSVDHAHYGGAKVKKDLSLDDRKIANDHRKDSAYYEYMGIPKKDARILSAVVTSARFLDTNGINLGFYKLGANTIFGLIPE